MGYPWDKVGISLVYCIKCTEYDAVMMRRRCRAGKVTKQTILILHLIKKTLHL
jgi:hypothetical protein